MPNLIESKGKTRSPSYYKGGDSASSSKTSKGKVSKAPILIGVVAVGAGLVLFMRSKGSSPASNTGPALTVIPSSEADQSTIANMLQALKAVGGLQTTNANPGGGTGTPITTQPNPFNTPYPSNPGGGVTISPQATSSAFMMQYGATPSALYDQTMAKILASPNTDIRNGVTYSKTPSEWEALFSQYGGPAGLAAYQVTANVPTPTAILNGFPTSGPSKPTSGGQAVANSFFTGVVGSTGPSGIVYQGYKDGQLVGQTTGGPNFNTSAWGASLGLNPTSWYA